MNLFPVEPLEDGAVLLKNQTATYSYNGRRLMGVGYSDGTSESFGYDTIGRRTSMSNASVTLNGQTMVSGQALALPANATQAVFTVGRAVAGQAMTVPLTVVDACGPWRTLVGAGTGVSGL